METIIPRLHASAPEPLGFGPSLEIRAFLLQRERGNLLIYRAATLEQDVEAVVDLGGVSRQYLNHHHEASPACDWVARTFGAPLYVHEADALAVSEVCNVDETFSGRHKIDEDLQIIPIPDIRAGQRLSCGTPGSIALCSPATRSSSSGAGGGLRCSMGSATGSGICRA
jgi:hypothetical protein